MLPELVEAAARFQRNGDLLPIGYKAKDFRWVVDVDEHGRGALLGPYERGSFTRAAPDRYRSGKASKRNLKPFLLADDGRYMLGIPEPQKQAEGELLHGGFVALAEQAWRETGDASVEPVVRFLRAPLPQGIRARVGPREDIMFRSGGDFPTDHEKVQRFWADHLGVETASGFVAECGICGKHGQLVQTLPQPVVILGQKCQISSFNLTAFESFGKKQTTNAPVCSFCASSFIAALQYLLSDRRHSAVLMRQSRRGESSLRDHVAVFWLREQAQTDVGGAAWDWEEALAGFMAGDQSREKATPESEAESLHRLERLLSLPWQPRPHALRLDENVFHLGVLSANKGRLVVREWLATPLGVVRQNLAEFLQALRIVQPDGSAARAVPLGALVARLAKPNPDRRRSATSQDGLATAHEIRGLLRTAYLGVPPAARLLEAALRALRTPKARMDEEVFHALIATVKLVRTYRTLEAKGLETLDASRHQPAYLAGRLLAVLEEAQRRSATSRLNTTIVDRFYGAAVTAPAANLGGYLVTQAQKAYFPKLRGKGRGGDLEGLMEQILTTLDSAGGFPRTLAMQQQGDFAIGFYHQRASFRTPRT